MEIKYGPYSPSRLDTASCPHRFKRQYIDRDIKDHGSHESRRGNVVHEVFEDITKGWIGKATMKWEAVLEVLTAKMTEYQIIDRNDRMLCIEAAQAYMDNPPRGLEHILGTEEHLAVKWQGKKLVECSWTDPDCFVRGKADILMIRGNTAIIVDHKTQPHIETSDTFQMGFYAWLVKILYPYVEEVETILHFCRPELNFYSKAFTWTPELIRQIETEATMEINMIEGYTEYPTVSNFYCKYCPVKLECPEIEKLQSLKTSYGKTTKGPLLSATQAQEAAQVINVVDEGRAILNKKLQSFVKEVGSVQIHGKVYGFSATESYEVKGSAEKRALMELLGNKGLDPYAYMKVDITALKKSWRGLDEASLQEIQALLTPIKKTSFRGRKA